jgi:hypothetical protein
MKQWEMAKPYGNDKCGCFFIGAVHGKGHLSRALQGTDFVVQAAATKIVPQTEYNPFECVKTNIIGAMNLIDTCIDCGVKRVVALSTRKASNLANLYAPSAITIVDHNGSERRVEDLRLMSACRHHILANGLFSWWSARLNSDPEKIALAPRRWFNESSIGMCDLVPDQWVRL